MTPHITPQELCGFLPNKLKARIENYKSDYVGNEYDTIVGIHQWDKNGEFWSVLTEGGAKPSITDIKPLVYPLSHLTKTIIHNGVKICPIVELAKIAFPNVIWRLENEEAKYLGQRFWYSDVYGFQLTGAVFPINQLALFQKLYEMKFDLHNWIGRGLGVDLSTLNK